MTRRGRLGALLVATITLTGCEMSSVDPDAPVTIQGSIVDSHGDGLAGRDVVLLTEPTVSDVFFGLPFGLGSVGLLCLAEDPPPPCDTRRHLTTDESGRFTFDLTGRETQGMFGEAARMTLSSRDTPQDAEVEGPATTGAFVVRSEQVALEPLALARAGLTLSGRAGRAEVSWAWSGQLRGAPASAELVVQDGTVPTWVTPANGLLDLRILEDGRGSVAVVEPRRAEGTIDDLTYRSELIPYASGAGAPVSRGATCRILGEDGPTVAVAPCPVTDGDLAERAPPTLACDDDPCPPAIGYEIDLDEPRSVELLVVRGCDRSCPLEVSTDGASWDRVVEVGGPYVAFPQQAASIRYVRVTGDAGPRGLAEVSVWDGPAAEATFTRRDPADDEARTDATGPSGPQPPWLWWLATLLVVAAAVAVGVAIGRRRA